MTNRPPVAPSALSEGRHPGYLLKIVEEPVPEGWVMGEKSPTMYRWFFALWEAPPLIPTHAPELQSGITSTKFAPKGKFQASKAYTWSCQLLQRHIQPGETINYDPLYPLPCSVKVSRDPGKDYIKVLDVEAWPEGAQYLTDVLKQGLAALLSAAPEPQPSAPPAPAPMAPASSPQGWGNPAPAQPAGAGKSGW